MTLCVVIVTILVVYNRNIMLDILFSPLQTAAIWCLNGSKIILPFLLFNQLLIVLLPLNREW